MSIVFFDTSCRRPYSNDTMRHTALGGTEATVARVAECLEAIVLQHNRVVSEGRFRPLTDQVDPSSAITLRDPKLAIDMAERYPRSRHFLWLHDLCSPDTDRGQNLVKHATRLAESGVMVLGVSEFHAKQIRRTLRRGTSESLEVRFIYNPVVAAAEGSLKKDPNKIVFFSSPHKGLGHATRLMFYLRQKMPELTLYVANPGYNQDSAFDGEGVVNLGKLSHVDVLRHVEQAFCTFYPNFNYPETFGLVMAESNAVQTPVLTHPIGAAPEVLINTEQMIPVPWIDITIDRCVRRGLNHRWITREKLAKKGLYQSYVNRLISWREGAAPQVNANPAFSLSKVKEGWCELLNL